LKAEVSGPQLLHGRAGWTEMDALLGMHVPSKRLARERVLEGSVIDDYVGVLGRGGVGPRRPQGDAVDGSFPRTERLRDT
jgi:hypothetical protein